MPAGLAPRASVAISGETPSGAPCVSRTFRVTTANSQRDVFVAFQDRSVLFSSFSTSLPWQPGSTYDYLYGVGLK